MADCSREFPGFSSRAERAPFELPTTGLARLALSSGAPSSLRRHVLRGLARIAVLMAVDAVALLLAWVLVGMAWPGPLPLGNLVTAGQFVVAVLLGLAFFGCYGSGDQRRDGGAVLRGAVAGVALAAWGEAWHQGLAAVLPLLLIDWLAASLLLVIGRRAVDRVVHLVRPTGEGVARAIVLGGAEEALPVIDHPALGETPWCHLVAFFDPDERPGDAAAELASLVRQHGADTIVIAGTLTTRAYTMALDAAKVSGCQVLSVPRVSPTLNEAPRLIWRDGVAVMELTRPERVGIERLAKRLLDVAVALIALAVAAPVMAVIALMVRLGSDGPVFFRQTRIGQGGRPFTIVKFRTMMTDSEAGRAALRNRNLYADGRLFKLRDDPRITRIGALLRRTSLDELPQFWNVLQGEMSLVGPRPPLPSEVEQYQAKDYARFDVKPGITGPWQVNGRNDVCDFEEVVRLETAYIRRWTIWLDFELLFRTVPAVLSGRGAH